MKCPTCALDLFELGDEDKAAIRAAAEAMSASRHAVNRKIGARLKRTAEKLDAVEELRSH